MASASVSDKGRTRLGLRAAAVGAVSTKSAHPWEPLNWQLLHRFITSAVVYDLDGAEIPLVSCASLSTRRNAARAGVVGWWRRRTADPAMVQSFAPERDAVVVGINDYAAPLRFRSPRSPIAANRPASVSGCGLP